MKRIFACLLSCFSAIACATELPVLFVSNGFTLNNQEAATIYLGPDQENYFDITLNASTLSAVLDSKTISNKKRNNVNFDASGNWNGSRFVISNKHNTAFVMAIKSHSKEQQQLILKFNTALYSTANDSYLTLKDASFILDGNNYQTLMDIIEK